MENKKNINQLLKAVVTGSLLFVLYVFAACSNNKEKTIVQVGDFELTEKALEKNIAAYAKPTEEKSEQLIKDWINEALILSMWDSVSYNKQITIETKLQTYKASLIRYELENKLIQREMDSIVSEKEMLAFYNKNKKEFELKDFIVKVLYLKLPTNAPNLEKVNEWYRLRNEKDIENIKKYVDQYALNFYFNENKWIYFEDLLKEIPLEGIDKEKFIFNQTKTHFEKSGSLYYLNILDFKLKNSISPFEFEKENIKRRILTYRIKTTRERVYRKILNNAKENYEVKYFNR